METINDRQLINLGIICLLAEGKEVTNRRLVDGTFWQDKRLVMWGRLLEMIDINRRRFPLERVLYCSGMGTLDIEDSLTAMILEASMYERVVTPLYEHKGDYYIVNPSTKEEMFLYYNLSPSMVIEASRYLMGDALWFLGQHEILAWIDYSVEIEEVRSKYKKREGST